MAEDGRAVEIIDQTRLPFELRILRLETLEDAAEAIAQMRVRGAPLIGATAAYGVCLALRKDASDAALESACRRLLATRPTAVNLQWALEEMARVARGAAPGERAARAWALAAALCEAEVAACRAIGEHGARLLAELAGAAERPARERAHPLQRGLAGDRRLGHGAGPGLRGPRARHRSPRLGVGDAAAQPGRGLTAWELAQHGVPHTVVADSAGGHLLQRGRVDLV